METPALIPVSDIYKLAALDLHRITPKKAEHSGRYWAFFTHDAAQNVLEDYDSGRLVVNARDYVSSINRVKDRIFDMERTMQRSESNHGRVPSR